jgi:ABC-type dipeptide/oligopeptide/nickel transport systems, permease components
MKKFRHGDRDLRAGTLIVGFVAAAALLSLAWTPFDAKAIDAAQRFAAPGWPHLLGTDNFGRDSLSRIMVGGRFSLLVSTCTVAIGCLFGLALGMPAAYFGGAVDEVVMRLVDALSSFPGILVALVMVTVLESRSYTIIVALGILFIPSFTRIARSGTLQFKDSEFARSARAFGASSFRVMFVHILPNLYPQLLSAIVVGLSNAILAESGMSYLGLGIQPPAPSWGRMLAESQAFLFNAPWGAIAPGLAIMLAVLGFNRLGEGLRSELGL